MSAPKRFFCDNINYPACDEAYLTGEELTHAKTVLRLEVGGEITLLDGLGGEYSAIVTSIEKSRLSAHIVGVIENDKEPKSHIYLLCGALKGDKTELVVQKCCELGVEKIGVFSSKYCSAYMNENKLARLNKVSHEAAKQCLRSFVPAVEYFADFTTALKSAAAYQSKLFFCEFAESSDTDFSKISPSVALVVGSEGGFSKEELDIARGLGFSSQSLGKRILRAETAAISACSIAAFILGELK